MFHQILLPVYDIITALTPGGHSQLSLSLSGKLRGPRLPAWLATVSPAYGAGPGTESCSADEHGDRLTTEWMRGDEQGGGPGGRASTLLPPTARPPDAEVEGLVVSRVGVRGVFCLVRLPV